MKVRVAAKRAEAKDVCAFDLVSAEPRELPSFTAGAHVDVVMRPDLVRQYSLCNSPHERDRYRIAVLRTRDSRGGSQFMHESLHVGDVIEIGEPRNHFPLAAAPRNVLIAGGIGITPLMSMATVLAAVGSEFTMHYCARSRAHAAFADHLLGASFGSRVTMHFSEGEASSRLDPARILATEETNSSHVYVCGPQRLTEAVFSAAGANGWSAAQLHREIFTPATNDGLDRAAEFEVQIASTQQIFHVPSDRSIAQVLIDHGVEVPTSCEQGVCGTCVTGVIDGVPEHRDSYLMDDERAKNDCMTLCCSRSKSRRLVLAL